MMKTTLGTSVAALIAFAGMESTGVNAIAVRQTDSSIEGYLQPEPEGLAQVQDPDIRSTEWSTSVFVTFENTTSEAAEIFWHDYSGNLVSYGTIAAGGTMNMWTYATHPWSATGAGNLSVDGDAVFVPEAGDHKRTIVIAQEWTALDGMCKDSMDRQYDDFRKPGGAYESQAQCQADCVATPGCMAINLSPTEQGGQCILRMTEGQTVSLDGYFQFWNYAGVGPVDHAQQHGDWKCYINPAHEWRELEGMCKDANDNQYDDFRKPNAAYDSKGQCQMDCAATPGCVGINLSETLHGGQCILRLSDGETCDLQDYFQFWNYAGKGAVSHAQPHGDFKCYVNPQFQ